MAAARRVLVLGGFGIGGEAGRWILGLGLGWRQYLVVLEIELAIRLPRKQCRPIRRLFFTSRLVEVGTLIILFRFRNRYILHINHLVTGTVAAHNNFLGFRNIIFVI